MGHLLYNLKELCWAQLKYIDGPDMAYGLYFDSLCFIVNSVDAAAAAAAAADDDDDCDAVRTAARW